ncbi:hypothetical protein AB0284_13605 [Pseudarthrobacter phenanthrenivorans]|uniref:hypothetical protein n=1 Tax=Micrococcaceae TaxID=1268 RepID=UPI00240F3B18|nr:hypothetical protein [Arthrobacter sp. NQ7]MDJ0456867.1 hypothetical protein [Arthrobacter sp. NQ7]
MGAIFGTALSVMLTVGGAAAAAGGQYRLAGHVLLGLGIGLLAATVLRAGARMLLARQATRARNARLEPAAPATVTVLPVRSASAIPLRGRHAA